MIRIIKFTAMWCADCIVMRPMWQEVRQQYPDLAIEEYDFDDQADQAKAFGITTVPTTIYLSQSGEEIMRRVGMQDKAELFDEIKNNLSH
ncbi:thioredoxin family protein [Candidatus Falkowbacteria bacterium]|nr:thioredoxin family protein [Candidatus Falkowbacteria bacterium]